MKMLKFVNQASSTFGVSPVSAAYSRTHRLWHRFAPRLMGSREVPRSWYAAPAVQLRSLQGHICCKGQSLSFVGITESASLHRISTTSNASYFGNAQSFWGTRYHYRKLSLTLSLSSNICKESGEGIAEKDLKREIDDLTDKFMETRELLEDAMEAKGTVYFNDDLKDAKESVQETLSQYEDLMTKLSEEQERNVRRTIGLKMEELRAQEAMIDESLKD